MNQDVSIFRLSLWALHNLDQGQPPITVLSLFLIRFFDHIGYRPDLQICASVQLPGNTSNRYSFDTTSGRIVCSVCSPQLPQGIATVPRDDQNFALGPGPADRTVASLEDVRQYPLRNNFTPAELWQSIVSDGISYRGKSSGTFLKNSTPKEYNQISVVCGRISPLYSVFEDRPQDAGPGRHRH